jgi:tetratricopeptide (TPR) repeat protein
MFVGLVLLGYGGVEAWLGNLSYDSPVKQRFCAAWLCPEEFYDKRTFTMLEKSAGGAAAQMLPQFQRSLAENSGSAYAWANLAEAERNAAHLDKAKYCFRQALAAGPSNPAILFRAANFAFETGDQAGTLQDLSAVLRNPDLSNYYPAAFLTYSRLNVPVTELLDKGVPPIITAAEPFLQFWMQDKKVPEAKTTWAWMVQHSLTTEKSVGDYTSFLAANREPNAAAAEWRRAYPKAASNYQSINWVFNGSFELEPKPGPFDWHIESTPDVEATRAQDVSRDGQFSVKLLFDGKENVDYHGTYQETVLTPGQWQLRAFVKLESITTDQGISIRIYDVDQPTRLDVRTESKTGSMPWMEVARAFAVGPETKLVRLEIMRGRSRKIDSKILGRAFVDSVELSPIR